jgi:rhamnogalacturonan endolyase
MRFFHLTALASAWPALVAGISVTEGDDTYVVAAEDTDDFTVTISSTDGSLTSILYGGDEFLYSDSSSGIASGLGSADVSYTTSGTYSSVFISIQEVVLTCTQGDYVVVSATASNADFNLTQYYIFQDGVSAIYMATNAVTEPEIGELRFIFRLVDLPNSYQGGNVSNIADGTAIEAEDCFLVDGQTRSKVTLCCSTLCDYDLGH